MSLEQAYQPISPEIAFPQASYAIITRYINNELHFLISKSALTGKWGLPGGKVNRELNESPIEALVREVWEETQLEVHSDQIDSFPLSRSLVDNGFGQEQLAHFYFIHGISGDPLGSEEMPEHRWVPAKELKKANLDLEEPALLILTHAYGHIRQFGRRTRAQEAS